MANKKSSQLKKHQRAEMARKADLNSRENVSSEVRLLEVVKQDNYKKLIEFGLVETAIDVAMAENKEHDRIFRESPYSSSVSEPTKLVYKDGKIKGELMRTPDGPAIDLGIDNPTILMTELPDAPDYDETPFTEEQIEVAETILDGRAAMRDLGMLPHLSDNLSRIEAPRADNVPTRR